MIKTVSRAPRITCVWTSRICYWFPGQCRAGPVLPRSSLDFGVVGASACLLHQRGHRRAGHQTLLGWRVSRYEAVTGPAAVFHLKAVPDVPPISPATQNWLVVPGWGAAAL